MMKKWEKFKGHFEDASAQQDDAEIAMPPSNARFVKAAKNVKLCFDDNHATILGLQEHMLPLSKCCELQEELIVESSDNCDNVSSCWYKNFFGTTNIPYTSDKQTDKYFVNAVCKVQARETHELTNKERDCVRKWLMKSNVDGDCLRM